MKPESEPTLEGLRLESLELIEDLKVVLGGQAHTATITRCFNDLFDLAYGLEDRIKELESIVNTHKDATRKALYRAGEL